MGKEFKIGFQQMLNQSEKPESDKSEVDVVDEGPEMKPTMIVSGSKYSNEFLKELANVRPEARTVLGQKLLNKLMGELEGGKDLDLVLKSERNLD